METLKRRSKLRRCSEHGGAVERGAVMETLTKAMLLLSLTAVVTSISDNVTNADVDNDVTSSPGKSPRSPYSSISPTVTKIFHVATVIIAVVGIAANAYVLLALLFSKNSHSSNVNVFITHQTVLDLTACTFLLLGLVVNSTLKMSYSLRMFICWLFSTFAMSNTVGNASICGLVIITIERYVKIVHPVAYRNHYRPWMTRIGIVIPWIFGICTALIPIWTTLRTIRGRCYRGTIGSNLAEKMLWSVAKFLLQYLGPLVVFVFGYWKILAVIRRQKKQVGPSHAQTASNAAMAAERANKRREMNVVRTMVLVSVSFAICFACIRTYNILSRLRLTPTGAYQTLVLLFTVFSYTNRCLNPFIYATQYEIVRRWWKVILCRAVSQQVQDLQASGTHSHSAAAGSEATKSRMTTKNV